MLQNTKMRQYLPKTLLVYESFSIVYPIFYSFIVNMDLIGHTWT